MLGYRSFFTVTAVRDGSDLVPTVIGQIYSWVRHKGLDADLVLPGAVATVGVGVEATLTVGETESGGRSVFFALRESKAEGTWTTQLMAHDPGRAKRERWVWVDVDAPAHRYDEHRAKWTAPPRLARDLLEVLHARDGGAILDLAPVTVTPDTVSGLVSAIEDPNRRGPVFVAGTDDTLPMQPWRDLVAKLLKQTVGLAAAYVLDAEATRQFAAKVGDTHAVLPGTMRTFLDDVAVGDEFDARRHRVLSADRIVRDSGHRVVRLLGGQAREMTLTRPIPRPALRIEELLLRRADGDAMLQPSRTGQPSAEPVAKSQLITAQRPQPTLAPLLNTEQSAIDLISIEAHLALVALTQDLLGTSDVTPGTITSLHEIADAARQAQSALERKDLQFTESQARVAALRVELADTRRQLQDEQLDHRFTGDDFAKSERNLLALRLRMQQVGRGDIAWEDATPDEVGAAPPESFDDLLARFDEFSYLAWTGNADVATSLDQHNPLGEWAVKTWSALRALDDYAALWLGDGFAGSVHNYLTDTPSGHWSFSANRHARDESDAVKNSDKYATARCLPGPDGPVFMGAHFKIAQFGLISPRMHYYDSLAANRRIYVGYIGPHLPTGKTN
jgi:hypothetical protein